MAYAKILVPVTGAPTDKAALATAFAAAAPFKSHVEALFVHADPRDIPPYIYGATVSTEVIQSIIDAQKRLLDAAEHGARLSAGDAAASTADAHMSELD